MFSNDLALRRLLHEERAEQLTLSVTRSSLPLRLRMPSLRILLRLRRPAASTRSAAQTQVHSRASRLV